MRYDGRETLFTRPDLPTKPKATPEDRAALLDRLRDQRQELVDNLALVAGDSGTPPTSSLWPLVFVETAIRAVTAVLDAEPTFLGSRLGEPGKPHSAKSTRPVPKTCPKPHRALSGLKRPFGDVPG